MFFTQLSVLVETGINLAKALNIIRNGLQSNRADVIVKTIQRGILEGKSFSEALGSFSNFFPPYVIPLVAAGENSGQLSQALEHIRDNMESARKIKNRLKEIFTYPMFVLIISLLIVFALVKFVFPPFINLFLSLKMSLPLFTVLFLNIAGFVSNINSFILFSFIIGLFITLFSSKDYGLIIKRRIDQIILSFPALKNVATFADAAIFCKALADLYSSGISIHKSMELASGIINNSILREQIQKAIVEVIEGKDLSMAIRENVFFPRIVFDFLFVAEKTGEVKTLLVKAAQFLQNEVDHKIENAQKLVEPFVVVTLGVIMGFFILVFFVPIYTAISGIGG